MPRSRHNTDNGNGTHLGIQSGNSIKLILKKMNSILGMFMES